jgi:hypothetical protein
MRRLREAAKASRGLKGADGCERREPVISHHKFALGYRADLRVVNRALALP